MLGGKKKIRKITKVYKNDQKVTKTSVSTLKLKKKH